ncbi:hypothetical protein BDZ97DRAFT_1790902 [Flammula alnicola]|nr:hypothetical protein BDZ97DRAFT_1790902 [Flammula alnicola]
MFWFSPRFSPGKDLSDMTAKFCGSLIMIYSHGVGYATVKHLALRGATVYLGARSEEKGLAALSSSAKDNSATANQPKPAKCSIITVIEHTALAKESAEKFVEREQRLDVLIQLLTRLTSYVLQSTTQACSHFGTFQFTQSLLPLLIKTSQEQDSDVRIVFVASVHTVTRAANPNIRFRTLDDFNEDFSADWFPAFSRYCVSKLTNVLTVKALQRRVLDNGITCIALHPGAVNTFSHRLPVSWLLNPIVNIFFVSPIGGENGKYRGAYLVPVGKIEVEELQEEIWESTVRILKDWEGQGQGSSEGDRVADA